MSQRAVQRPEIRTSLLIGGLVALAIAIAGGIFALAQKTLYTAEAVIVILPSADLETAASAAYYETLSRGQIVATFAEVAGNLRFEQQAEEQLLFSDAQRAAATTIVSVVPNTSVVLVRASAEDPRIAEQLADGTATVAGEYLGSLAKPYRSDLVQDAHDSAYQSSTAPALLLALAMMVALIAGLAIQQASYHLLMAIRRPKRNAVVPGMPGEVSSAPSPDGGADSRGARQHAGQR